MKHYLDHYLSVPYVKNIQLDWRETKPVGGASIANWREISDAQHAALRADTPLGQHGLVTQNRRAVHARNLPPRQKTNKNIAGKSKRQKSACGRKQTCHIPDSRYTTIVCWGASRPALALLQCFTRRQIRYIRSSLQFMICCRSFRADRFPMCMI